MALKDKKEENKALLNENIPFSRVLLVSEDGKEKKEITRLEALNQAKKSSLDLFCVAPSAALPVCKLVNYYQLSKKKKKIKENICKEFSVSLNIGKNDLKTKLKQIEKWIEKGATVKVKLVMSGKQRIHPNLAYEKCQKEIIDELKNQSPKIELRDNIQQHLNTLYFFLYKRKQ